MSGETGGQMAYEAFTAVRYAGALTTAWTSPTVAHKAWEAAAAAVETRQVRLAREDRDAVRGRMLALAAEWEADAAMADIGASRRAEGSISARAYRRCAAEVRKGLDV